MSDDRDLVVTVTARIPLSKVIDEYREALTPDGGYTGTSNAYVEGYAQGLIEEMTPGGVEIAASWKLEPKG